MNKGLASTIFDFFCRVSTSIFIFTSLYVGILRGFNCEVYISYVYGILCISLLMAVTWVPLIGERNLSKNLRFISNVIYFVCINIVVWITGYYLDWFCVEKIWTCILLEGSIVFVWSFLNIFYYLSDRHTAEEMLKKIKDRAGEKTE